MPPTKQRRDHEEDDRADRRPRGDGGRAERRRPVELPGAEPTKVDQGWVQEALRIDLFEIKGGELAMRQASNLEVASLGAMLAREHAVAFAEDREVARENRRPGADDAEPGDERRAAEARRGERRSVRQGLPPNADRRPSRGDQEGESGDGAGSDVTAVDAAAMNLRMYAKDISRRLAK